MNNIESISFPNTVIDSERGHFEIGKSCDKIKNIKKNGETTGIGWFQIIKNNKIIAEIKESVCDIFGEDEIEKEVF